jgi:thioesterase domain-containing protein/acyl carrier protein
MPADQDGASVDDVFEVVRKAWIETVPKANFDPDMTWDDAGADSMKSLQLLMRIEEGLGRKLSFDLFSGEMTARQIAMAIAEQRQSEPNATAIPHMYLVPGVYGDAPATARFRKAMADTIDLELVDLPGLDMPIAMHRDIGATARHVADEIERRQPSSPIMLAGYSFGGIVAFEAARELRHRGHAIGLLCLIDTHLPSDTVAPALIAEAHPGHALGHAMPKAEADAKPAARSANLLRSRHRTSWRRLRPDHDETRSAYVDRLLFALLVRLGRMDAARRIARKPASAEQRIWRTKVVFGLARHHAMSQWRPVALDVPVRLLASQDGIKAHMPDLWAALCPDLTVTTIDRTHRVLLEPDLPDSLKQGLADALKGAARKHGS